MITIGTPPRVIVDDESVVVRRRSHIEIATDSSARVEKLDMTLRRIRGIPSEGVLEQDEIGSQWMRNDLP